MLESSVLRFKMCGFARTITHRVLTPSNTTSLRQVNGSRLNLAATSPTAVYGMLSKRSSGVKQGGQADA